MKKATVEYTKVPFRDEPTETVIACKDDPVTRSKFESVFTENKHEKKVTAIPAS